MSKWRTEPKVRLDYADTNTRQGATFFHPWGEE
jgi:hypothetical protein